MAHHICAYMLILCCVVSPLASAGAQTSIVQSSPQVKEPSAARRPSARKEGDPLFDARYATAIALVTSLADDARSYRNETLRVRIQARAADALWENDRDRSLALFHRAWEEAASIDKAGEQRVEGERKRYLTGRGSIGFIPPVPNLRLEVLKFVSRRDQELGEKFLASLEEEKGKEASDTTPSTNLSNYWDPTEPPPALTKRLELAQLILESGDVERALRFADPALARVTKPGIIFLYKLRQKKVVAADQRYAALLTRSAVDPSADANTVSLLSSYAFTPLVFATVTRNGRAYGGEAAPVPDLSAELRVAFFRAATHVLLRPVTPPNEDRSSAGRAGTHFVIARLLPLFEQYAPDRVPELRARLAFLTPDVPESMRNDYMMLTAGFTSEAPPADDAQVLLDQLRRASNSAERDRIYVSILRGIIKTDALRAREIADKIENPDLRKRIRAFVDFVAIRTALERKNTEDALRLARAADLSSIQRVWAYTEVARLIGKSDPGGVLQLLNEAAAEARRIDQSRPERTQSLTAIATSFFDVDRPRSWEMMAEAVKAAEHADFIGEGGKVATHLHTEGRVAMLDLEVPSFDLKGIFSLLANDDLQRSIELAKGFTAEDLRAIAILAVARSVLDKKLERVNPQKR